MESRKYQLQKQIIEALKAKDNDLYSLLKSQWAHRFGVESLEELKNLDLNQSNRNSTNVNNKTSDQLQINNIEDDKPSYVKDGDNPQKEINNKELEPNLEANNQTFKIKSYEIVDKQNNKTKSISPLEENKTLPKIKALIPLPPKPKYSYLKKWLLRK